MNKININRQINNKGKPSINQLANLKEQVKFKTHQGGLKGNKSLTPYTQMMPQIHQIRVLQSLVKVNNKQKYKKTKRLFNNNKITKNIFNHLIQQT